MNWLLAAAAADRRFSTGRAGAQLVDVAPAAARRAG
jgi:hypothetical protein